MGAAVYPEGRLGAQDARSELRGEVGPSDGKDTRPTAVLFTHVLPKS